MPATAPPEGTVSFVNAPRGDPSRRQAINVPNWASSTDRITVTFNDFVQDVNSWGECKRARGNARLRRSLDLRAFRPASMMGKPPIGIELSHTV